MNHQDPLTYELRFDDGKLFLQLFQHSSHGLSQPRRLKQMRGNFQMIKKVAQAMRKRFDSYPHFVAQSSLSSPSESAEDRFEIAAYCYGSLIALLKDLGIQRRPLLSSSQPTYTTSHIQDRPCYWDRARQDQPVDLSLKAHLTLRIHQRRALEAWQQAQGRGSVVLPTGAGKTYLACQVMAQVQCSVMVVVPTLDLMEQWGRVIKDLFRVDAGFWGGGKTQLADVTIITYDSAIRVCKQHGDRFGLIIFDECHHLAAPVYQSIARCALAPYRLGLSATIEREDHREVDLVDLIGDVVYRAQISEMESSVLSPYDVITWRIPLSDRDQALYDESRDIYLRYLRYAKISFHQKNSWQQFIFSASRSVQGRRALSAYRSQRRIACNSFTKIQALWDVLSAHADEKILVFTQDNELAYRIGLYYVLPVITHHTKKPERKRFLHSFHEGELRCLVTSKVLNEGVDVPDASVGVVVSGTGSVREHVQRLGRILRHRDGKRAKLYELVSDQTGEISTQYRRQAHDAYQRAVKI